MKIKKAVVPAAGLGTRFLPVTKNIPKEMLPIVDTPIILYVIEEAVKAGIEDIILIQGRGKTAIEDFFDVSYELEDKLMKSGNQNMLERLKNIRDMANIISLRQKYPNGLGHAVLCAEPIIGKNPFSVLLGDEIVVTEENKPTAVAQLSQTMIDTRLSTVAVMSVAKKDVSKYGIINGQKVSDRLFKVQDLIEKPQPENAPSPWAIVGRYVFTGKIFDYIKETVPGVNGEVQLTDAMDQLAKNEGLMALDYQGIRYDAGDKLGFVIANIEMALKNPELSPGLLEYLSQFRKA